MTSHIRSLFPYGLQGYEWARSIQPKFQPVWPGKLVHLKRWTRFFETFPVGPNRSIEFWTEISGNFGWIDRAQCFIRKPTIPKFKSSYSSGRSEYSLVEPYKLMKHGPNKGRNPVRKKNRITGKGETVQKISSCYTRLLAPTGCVRSLKSD